jgi:hypothetical protein
MTMTIGFDTLIDTHKGAGGGRIGAISNTRSTPVFLVGKKCGTEFLASLQRPQMILFKIK